MPFSEKNLRTYVEPPPHQSAHTDLKILQWNPGGMSQNKKTELHLNLVKHNVDIFAILESNLTAEKLIDYRTANKKTYTFNSVPIIFTSVQNSYFAETCGFWREWRYISMYS